MTQKLGFRALFVLTIAILIPVGAFAAPSNCDALFAKAAGSGANLHEKLKAALSAAQSTANGGFGLDMWATIVDRDGVVCAVAFSGDTRGDQWPGSRVISAQKANTANAFSLPKLALSTANLYTAVQPGGSLFGLQESNPVNPAVAYDAANVAFYGTLTDPMVGKQIGGVNVFGGGLALYPSTPDVTFGAILGGVGVSGDSSCADHNIAWKVRSILNLDNVPAGVATGGKTDNIVYDINQPGNSQAIAPKSASGWGHPTCSSAATTIGNALPTTYPVGP